MRVALHAHLGIYDALPDTSLGARSLGLLLFLSAAPRGVETSEVFERFPQIPEDEIRALLFILIESGYLRTGESL